MKLLIPLLLLFTTVSAQAPAPRAVAKFCGNMVVRIDQQQKLQQHIHEAGCQQAVFVQIDDEHVLGYGVYVDVIGSGFH